MKVGNRQQLCSTTATSGINRKPVTTCASEDSVVPGDHLKRIASGDSVVPGDHLKRRASEDCVVPGDHLKRRRVTRAQTAAAAQACK